MGISLAEATEPPPIAKAVSPAVGPKAFEHPREERFAQLDIGDDARVHAGFARRSDDDVLADQPKAEPAGHDRSHVAGSCSVRSGDAEDSHADDVRAEATCRQPAHAWGR